MGLWKIIRLALFFLILSSIRDVHLRVTVVSIDSVHPNDLEAAKHMNPSIFLRSSESLSFQYTF